jgi:hypothetical protein
LHAAAFRRQAGPPAAAVDGGPGVPVQRRLHTQAALFSSFIDMRTHALSPARIAVLPRAPINASPVPWLTSLYHKVLRGEYGDPRYPGNCSGELIKDLLLYFRPKTLFDPMTGSGTCRDVCDELAIDCLSKDIRFGFDACDPKSYEGIGTFDFVWLHPPYWRQKKYSDDLRDLSNAPTLSYFLHRYRELLDNCAHVLSPGGRIGVLMGDYTDRDAGFVPLTYHTKRLCFALGLRQCCTEIIRFSHGASSSTKVYRSSFIPGLHDVCTIFEKSNVPGVPHARAGIDHGGGYGL